MTEYYNDPFWGIRPKVYDTNHHTCACCDEKIYTAGTDQLDIIWSDNTPYHASCFAVGMPPQGVQPAFPEATEFITGKVTEEIKAGTLVSIDDKGNISPAKVHTIDKRALFEATGEWIAEVGDYFYYDPTIKGIIAPLHNTIGVVTDLNPNNQCADEDNACRIRLIGKIEDSWEYYSRILPCSPNDGYFEHNGKLAKDAFKNCEENCDVLVFSGPGSSIRDWCQGINAKDTDVKLRQNKDNWRIINASGSGYWIDDIPKVPVSIENWDKSLIRRCRA